jgi:hypothetical protein
MRSITNRSSSDRTTQLRRRAEWLSRDSIRNAYTATQESYTSNVAGRIAAANDECCRITVDDDVYVVSRFTTTAPYPRLNIYDSNNALDISMSAITLGTSNCFLVKYDKTGQPKWAAKMGNPSNSSFLPSLVADTNGDIYVTWLLRGTQLQLYDASSVVPSISMTLDSSDRKIIVAKYSSDGVAQWATYISGNGFAADISSNFINTPTVSIDSNHNVHLNVDYFAPGGLIIYQASSAVLPIKTYLPTPTNYDSILIKYDTNGAFLWAANVGSTSTELSSTIACDKDNNVYIAGAYASSSPPLRIYNSDNSLASITLQNAGSYDTYLIKYNSSGFAQWGVRIGGTSPELKPNICVNADGDIQITGCYRSNTITVYSNNNVPAFTLALTSPSTSNTFDIFLVKYNTAGIAQWASKIGGSGNDISPSLTIDSNNNIIVSAPSYSTSISVESSAPVPPIVIMPTIVGAVNPFIFLVSYNTNGIVNWGTRIENTFQRFIFPNVTVDKYGDIYITSDFGVNTTLQIYDVDGSTSVRTVTSGGLNRSTFLVKYSSTGISTWAAKILQNTFYPVISTPFKTALL